MIYTLNSYPRRVGHFWERERERREREREEPPFGGMGDVSEYSGTEGTVILTLSGAKALIFFFLLGPTLQNYFAVTSDASKIGRLQVHYHQASTTSESQD